MPPSNVLVPEWFGNPQQVWQGMTPTNALVPGATSPAVGQALTWNGNNYVPGTGGSSPGSPVVPLYKSANFVASSPVSLVYLVDTSGGAVVATIEPPSDGVEYTFVDYANSWGVHALSLAVIGPLTIAELPPNYGVQSAGPIVLNQNGIGVTYLYSARAGVLYLI